MGDLLFYLMIWVSGFVIGFAMSTTDWWRAIVRDRAERSVK
jgi:hypothetical protein